MTAYVYILLCRDGSLYTGVAKDVAARLRQHLAGRASRYTRGRLPVVLLWTRAFDTWGDALREEYRIKQLRRGQKRALVAEDGTGPVLKSSTRALIGRRLSARRR